MATIFIYCNGAMVADREQKDRDAGATEPGAAALELYIQKHLSIVAKRTALARTGVDTQAAILEECDIG